MIEKLDHANLKVPQDIPLEQIIREAMWDKTNEIIAYLNTNATLQEHNQSLLNYIENLKFSDNKTIQALEDKRKNLEAELVEVKGELSHAHNDFSDFSKKFDEMEKGKDKEIAELKEALAEIIKGTSSLVKLQPDNLTFNRLNDIAQQALNHITSKEEQNDR